MQSDEVIWSVIGPSHSAQFCSYKVRSDTQSFCRNEYNVTGLCNRQSCPLANSRYATVREDSGRLYLCVKTIERAHTPAKMWEKIPLSLNYAEALKEVDQHLIYWPNFYIHKCKQRITKMTQYLAKIKSLSSKTQPQLIGIKPKMERRESTRERKALTAARLEQAIEKELIGRLKSKAYGDAPLNVNEQVWQTVLEAEKNKSNALAIESDDSGLDEDEEEEDEDEDENEVEEFVSDDSLEESDLEDLEDYHAEFDSDDASEISEAESLAKKRNIQSKAPDKRRKSRGPRVEVEYEEERELEPRLQR